MQDQPIGVFGLFIYIWHNWDNIQNQWSVIFQTFITLIGLIVTLASVITPLTSTPKDDELLAGLKNWLHQLSITNAKDVKGVGQDDQVLPWRKDEK